MFYGFILLRVTGVPYGTGVHFFDFAKKNTKNIGGTNAKNHTKNITSHTVKIVPVRLFSVCRVLIRHIAICVYNRYTVNK
jgi:hypothetical protein